MILALAGPAKSTKSATARKIKEGRNTLFYLSKILKLW
jgi:hypothetical protein